MFTKITSFVDQLLDRQIQAIVEWSTSPDGELFKITKEGG